MNFGEAKALMLDLGGVKSGSSRMTTTTAGIFINRAIVDLSEENQFNVNWTETTLDAHVGSLVKRGASLKLTRIFGIWYTNDLGKLVKLEHYLDFDQFDLDVPESVDAADPVAWSERGGTVYWRPVPESGVRTLTLRGWKVFEDMVADADTNALLTLSWPLVLYTALARYGGAYLLEGEMTQMFAGMAQNALTNLLLAEALAIQAPGLAPREEVGREIVP